MALALRSLLGNLRGDFFGGLTTGLVALPLALALGVASGAGAAAGIYSAIFTGIIAAIFGGTPAQISGPTAGMTAVLIGVFQTTGLQGLFAAMCLGGLIQIGFALLRLGKFIHYLPRPVVYGFTNGIAALIFWKQFKDIYVPGGPMFSLPEQVLAAAVVLWILLWPRVNRHLPWPVPGSLVALAAATAATIWLNLPVKLLGPLPTGLPAPSFPLAGITLASAPVIVKAGLVIALLGTIESLLAALVVDEMTGTRHHSDREIFGQGLANAIAPCFGGLAGTGAIVRSAVNVRSGGRTPLAAVIHSLLILAVALGLGRYTAVIPVPALWGILIATSFGMVEWHSLGEIARAPKSDSAAMLVTTLLTVVEDLTVGVAAGLLLSFILFTIRMAGLPVRRINYGKAIALTVDGPMFFGVARAFMDAVESVPPGTPQIWDFSQVPMIDATGAAMLRKTKEEAERRGSQVTLVGLQARPRAVLERMGILSTWDEGAICADRGQALAALRVAAD